ncbi:MAG TPA: nucleoside hydrolase, partial [Gaiellales bacterium]|nr:nucleoside hydrolase [Gaiellales bacterium]
PAVDLIAELATSDRAPVTLVATGPLTNVALFAARHPRAAAALARVVIMGGSIGLGNVTPAAEFNIWADPDAARRVFTSGLDVTMVGLDVTHQALLSPVENEDLRGCGRAGRLTAELVDFYRRSHPHMPGTPIHDAVAVAQVVRPELLTLEQCHVEVDCGPVSRGRTLVDLHGVTGRPANVHVATAIDGSFTEFLGQRIASLG